jgi:hypothetical protein
MAALLVHPADALLVREDSFPFLVNDSLRAGLQGAVGVCALAAIIYKISHAPPILCFFSGAVGFAVGCIARNVYTNYPLMVKPLRGLFLLDDKLLFTRVPLFLVSLIASYKFTMLSMAMGAMSGWMAGLTFRAVPIRDQMRV